MTKPNKPRKRRAYPPKYRAERAELILKTRPFDRACGPRTAAGKAKSSRNALKHGLRSEIVRELRRILAQQKSQLRSTFPVTGD